MAGIISMVPGIDHVMDVRDLLGSLFKMAPESGRTNDNVLELSFTLIGLVPTVGSAGRMGLRLLFDGKSLKSAMAHLNGANYGNARKWLQDFNVSSVRAGAFAAAAKGLKLLDDIAASLKKNNVGVKGALIPDNVVTAAQSLATVARRCRLGPRSASGLCPALPYPLAPPRRACRSLAPCGCASPRLWRCACPARWRCG